MGFRTHNIFLVASDLSDTHLYVCILYILIHVKWMISYLRCCFNMHRETTCRRRPLSSSQKKDIRMLAGGFGSGLSSVPSVTRNTRRSRPSSDRPGKKSKAANWVCIFNVCNKYTTTHYSWHLRHVLAPKGSWSLPLAHQFDSQVQELWMWIHMRAETRSR